MVKAPYPVVPVVGESDWFDEHPAAKVVAGVLVLVGLLLVFAVGTLCLVEYSFHHNDLYREALARASSDQRITQAIGQPVHAGWVVLGNIQTQNGRGRGYLRIPISGPNGSGKIEVGASEISGQWELKTLFAVIRGRNGAFDLLTPNAESGEVK